MSASSGEQAAFRPMPHPSKTRCNQFNPSLQACSSPPSVVSTIWEHFSMHARVVVAVVLVVSVVVPVEVPVDVALEVGEVVGLVISQFRNPPLLIQSPVSALSVVAMAAQSEASYNRPPNAHATFACAVPGPRNSWMAAFSAAAVLVH